MGGCGRSVLLVLGTLGLVAMLLTGPNETAAVDSSALDSTLSLLVHKHPQEFFCEADFVIVAKVLRKTTSDWSVADDVPAFLLCLAPAITPILLVRVKHVFKGHGLVAKDDIVPLAVSCHESADLGLVQRRTYVLSGFVHLERVPRNSKPCADYLDTGRHVFRENQLNFMLGCSWIQPRSQITAEHKRGLAWAYFKSCGNCEVIKCLSRGNCSSDLQRALDGDGCVMHHGNGLLTSFFMTCSRPCLGDPCEWVTCSSREAPCGCGKRHPSKLTSLGGAKGSPSLADHNRSGLTTGKTDLITTKPN